MWLHNRAFLFPNPIDVGAGVILWNRIWNPKQGGSAYKANLVMQMPHQRRMQNHTAKVRRSFSQRWR
jgi:hypothetical protein